jgi:Uma2 family endonuclease
MAIPAEKCVSVEEYLRLEDAAEEKHEYVDGDVVAMAGATLEHNQIVSNLIYEMGLYLKGKDYAIYPSDFRVTTPAGISYFYPDATVVGGNTELQPNVFDTLLNPVIIFEVMSEGIEKMDRGYKFFYYQQIPSLQEYILIDSRTYAVEAIRRQADDAWRFDKFSPADGKLHLSSVNCILSFEDIYYRVQFLPLK